MINSRDNDEVFTSDSKYNVPYSIGQYLESISNSEVLIKIMGYYIDKTGITVYVNHNIYSNNIDDCEIMKLKELNEKWKVTSNMHFTYIPQEKVNIGLKEMLKDFCGTYEVSEQGVTLVKNKK